MPITHQSDPFTGISVRRSPRPLPSRLPPLRQNGTSAPTSAAMVNRLTAGRRSPQRRSRASRAAAPSALPPPSPEATGMPLRRRKRAPGRSRERRASSLAATSTRLLSSGGSAAPSTSSPRPSAVSRTSISSHSPTACMIVTTSWKRSSRVWPTSRARLIFAAARTFRRVGAPLGWDNRLLLHQATDRVVEPRGPGMVATPSRRWQRDSTRIARVNLLGPRAPTSTLTRSGTGVDVSCQGGEGGDVEALGAQPEVDAGGAAEGLDPGGVQAEGAERVAEGLAALGEGGVDHAGDL